MIDSERVEKAARAIYLSDGGTLEGWMYQSNSHKVTAFRHATAALAADAQPVWKLTPDPQVGFVARSVKYPWCSGHGDTEEVAIKMASENLESLRCSNCGAIDGDTGNGASVAKGINPIPEPLVHKDAGACPHNHGASGHTCGPECAPLYPWEQIEKALWDECADDMTPEELEHAIKAIRARLTARERVTTNEKGE